MSTPYGQADFKWCWKPEITFGKVDSGKAQWAANAAGDTFFGVPLQIDEGWATVRQRKNFERIHTGGSRYFSAITQNGYHDGIITLGGPVLDHSMFMFFGTDICTNTDATPNIHQCDDADTYPATPPTFAMLRYTVNPTAAETVYDLYLGCIIVRYEEGAAASGTLIGNYTIHYTKNITGVALTTFPERHAVRAFQAGDGVLTWTNAAVAYKGLLKDYKLVFEADKRLAKGWGSYYAAMAQNPNKTNFWMELSFQTYETDTYDDSQDDPTAAGDKDCTMKISRSAIDYFQVSFTDIFQEMQDEFLNDENKLEELHRIDLNPYDAGSTWDITEYNTLDSTRYKAETA